jgi:hypothetical protein
MTKVEDDDDDNFYSCSTRYGFLANAACLNHRHSDVGKARQREDEQGAQWWD